MTIARLMQMARAGVPAGGGDVWTDPDLANAGYDSVSFSISGQTGAPTDVNISPDGYKIFISGNVPDAIFKYDLSTPFDLSTATYNSVSFSLAAANADCTSFTFSSNGLKMYTTDFTDDSVYEYDLSSAFDISTASYNSVSLNVSAAGNDPQSVAISADGYKLFVLGLSDDTVYQYSLSTAFDISTASYDSVSFSVGSQDSVPTGILFSPVGLTMFVTGNTTDSVYMYSLTSAWDLSTASYSGDSFSVASQDTNPRGVAFKYDGSKMYVVGSATDTIYQYSTAAAAPAGWTDPDLANAGYDGVSFSVLSQDNSPSGIFFKPDGQTLYISGYQNNDIYQYSLSAAWDITTASYTQNFSVSTQTSQVTDLFFKPDGSKMYIVENTNDNVHEYNISVSWDITTASYSQSFSIAAQETAPQGFFFKSDGTKMYITGSASDSIHEYDLSSAWNISTSSFLQSLSVSAQEIGPLSLYFNPDGTKMYFSGFGGDDVNEYGLSIAWDISTASYARNFFVGSQDANPAGIAFKSDGSKMYIVGLQNDAIYQYSTA